jgi:glycosyltransferase involved in cell wall biosynthesis
VISIIIPVYNRVHIIQKTLHSIVNQSFVQFECIIVDDYSTDSIQEEFINWQLDERFSLVKNNRSKGAQGSRNTGLLYSKGTYVCFFDSDNLMKSNFLELFSKKFEEASFDAITCYSSLIKERAKIGGMSYNNSDNVLKNLIKNKTYIDFNSLVISKNHLLNNVGLLDENVVSHQELDLAFRLATSARFGTIKKYLVDYVLDGNDRISTIYIRGIRGKILIYSKYDSIVKLLPIYKIQIWIQIILEYNKHCKNHLGLKLEIISEIRKVKLSFLKYLLK